MSDANKNIRLMSALSAQEIRDFIAGKGDAELATKSLNFLLMAISDAYPPDKPPHVSGNPMAIGKLFIGRVEYDDNKLWIGEVEGGEGGSFNKSDLAPVLQKFYDDNF